MSENPFDAIAHDLGWHDHNMSRSRPYNGQPHTVLGIRGETKISGATFRDLRDCYIRGMCLARGVDNPAHYSEAEKGQFAALCENDLYDLKGDYDPMAVFLNMALELEKLMGIYPNVPNLEPK